MNAMYSDSPHQEDRSWAWFGVFDSEEQFAAARTNKSLDSPALKGSIAFE